jgi:hypothetical protein
MIWIAVLPTVYSHIIPTQQHTTSKTSRTIEFLTQCCASYRRLISLRNAYQFLIVLTKTMFLTLDLEIEEVMDDLG